jgi:hypothetical protein
MHERSKGDFSIHTSNTILQLAHHSNVIYVTEMYSGPSISINFTIHCFFIPNIPYLTPLFPYPSLSIIHPSSCCHLCHHFMYVISYQSAASLYEEQFLKTVICLFCVLFTLFLQQTHCLFLWSQMRMLKGQE